MSFYLKVVSVLPNETVTGPSTDLKSYKSVQRGFLLTVQHEARCVILFEDCVNAT